MYLGGVAFVGVAAWADLVWRVQLFQDIQSIVACRSAKAWGKGWGGGYEGKGCGR